MQQAEILKGGIEVVEQISDEWIALCEEGPCNVPFLRPEWFAAFVKNFETEIEIVTVRCNGKLRAVLPLVAKRGSLHGIPVSKFQGIYNLNTQRFDIIHGTDESEKRDIVRALWNAIRDRKGWSVLEWRLVRRGSWIAGLLELAERESCPAGIWEMDGAPYIRLPTAGEPRRTINEFLKGSRKQLRQQLDRRKRRLSEAGKIDFVITREYTPALLDRYFALESKGWKGRQGTAVTDDPSVAKLHHEFTRAASDRDELFAYELRLDGKTIAMSINMRCGRTMFHWKTSYDESYSKYSPGNLLFKMFVANCLELDVQEIDLLSPSTANKRYWSSGEREHAAYYIFKPGIVGSFLWFWKFGLVSKLRKLKSTSQPKLVPLPLQNSR